MNEHIWKKLGEVKAFAHACADYLDRGREGFTSEEIFSTEEIDQFIKKCQHHITRIEEISSEAEMADTVNKKADATGKKLTAMQDLYLADEDDWQDGMELLEWSGFFFGAAIVHWRIIEGVSEHVHEADLTALSASGLGFYTQVFETAGESIKALAKEEAAE